ncbi:MAG: type II toxin-antitoxin system VapC family toxin [Paracoccaceae bacterium]
MFILDTDIVSLLRRVERHPQLADWARRVNDADVRITVVTLGEIARGIHRQRRRNPPFAEDLTLWAQEIGRVFADRLLDFDRPAAAIWGRLTGERGYENSDLLIAAIALSRDATVVTRHAADFVPTGVRIENPFAA